MGERRLQPRLGTRKLHVVCRKGFAQAGVKVGRDRLFEILRGHDLLLKRKRSQFPRTTHSSHRLPLFRNRVREMVAEVRPNEVWVADITYIRTAVGFLYLALLTDKASRKIVGYHCGDTLEAEGCLNALQMALKDLPSGMYPVHHSDRGVQYCCGLYVDAVVKRGLSISMTEQDHCAENALAERMNGILKSEYGLDAEFQTKEQARLCVDQAVCLYNTRRPHTALKYRFPQEVHAALN